MKSEVKFLNFIIFLLAAFVLVYIGIRVKELSLFKTLSEASVAMEQPPLAPLEAEPAPPISRRETEGERGGKIKVIRIIDGDTIEIENNQQVRYLSINTPELGEPYFNEASQENKRLVEGREVKLEFDVQTKDRFERLLAYLWAGDIMVNEELARGGFAVSQTIQPNVKYQDRILSAQKEARENCRGLWASLCQQHKEGNCVEIIKINANAPGNDNENKNGEWIEIRNNCSESVLMDGWLLRDSSASNRYDFGDFNLGAQKTVIIYSGCGENTSEKLFWKCPEGKYAVWNNSGDHAFLYDADRNLVAEYQY